MRAVRRAADRGVTQIGWLDSRHTFSFGRYQDPKNVQFRALRVINDDRVTPGAGFGTHGHRDMEIVSVVVEGALAHRDSLGNGSEIRAGDVQRMTAGTGIRHSEFNASKTESVRFLQIWIPPERRGLAPGYEQKHFDPVDRQGSLKLVVSPSGEGESIRIHRDVRIYLASLTDGQAVEHTIAPGRHAWVQVVTGSVEVDGTSLTEGDGLAISEESAVHLRGEADTEVVVFDLP